MSRLAHRDAEELARNVSHDLGRVVTAPEVRIFLATGTYPDRLTAWDRREMEESLRRELLRL